VANPLFGDHPIVGRPAFGDHPIVDAAPVSLGETPDVFTEAAAQAAAPPSPGLGNEIERGLLTGGRGLALANAGLYEMASPILSEATKANLQAPSFALADRLKAQQDAIPASDIGSQMVGGLVSGPVAMLGSAGARGQDVVAAGGTPAQGANATNIALSSELPALALPALGTSIPARVALQGAAGGALSELGRVGENAVLPPDQQRAFSLPELAQAAGGAGLFGLIPHGAEPMPQTSAEVAALRREPVQPPPAPAELPPTPETTAEPAGTAATLPPEPVDAAPVARPEVPAEVPGGVAGERPPVVPDVPGAAAGATEISP